MAYGNLAIGVRVKKCTIVDATIREGVVFVNSSISIQQRRRGCGRPPTDTVRSTSIWTGVGTAVAQNVLFQLIEFLKWKSGNQALKFGVNRKFALVLPTSAGI